MIIQSLVRNNLDRKGDTPLMNTPAGNIENEAKSERRKKRHANSKYN